MTKRLLNITSSWLLSCIPEN